MRRRENIMRFGSGLELVVILIIVILVFGVGRIGKLGADLGAGIRAFRKNLSGEDESEDKEKKA
jgi:sec-independent protein translocase protein TatA